MAEVITSGFSGLIDGISNLFTTLITNIYTVLYNLANSLYYFIEHFSDYFNNFLTDLQSYFDNFLVGFRNSFSSVVSLLGDIGNYISNGFQTLYSNIYDFFSTVLQGFQTSLSSIVQFLTGFFNSLGSSLSYLFVPDADYWEEGFPSQIRTAFENKFGFLTGFKNAFDVMANQQGQSLNYQFSWGGRSYQIDFSWYAPFRVSVRELFAVLFTVLAWLRVYKVISSVFGIWSGETVTNALKEG